MSGKDKGKGGRKPLTQLVQAGRKPEWTGMPGQPGGIVSPPVWRASTILYDDVAHLRQAAASSTHERLFYGRKGTPTAWSLADALTEMEPGAEGTMLFPSGVAAIACALMAVLKPGDRLLMVDSAYDPTRSFCTQMLSQHGVETVYYDPQAPDLDAHLAAGPIRAISGLGSGWGSSSDDLSACSSFSCPSGTASTPTSSASIRPSSWSPNSSSRSAT